MRSHNGGEFADEKIGAPEFGGDAVAQRLGVGGCVGVHNCGVERAVGGLLAHKLQQAGGSAAACARAGERGYIAVGELKERLDSQQGRAGVGDCGDAAAAP